MTTTANEVVRLPKVAHIPHRPNRQTVVQKANCEKLAKHLWNRPVDERGFDMRFYALRLGASKHLVQTVSRDNLSPVVASTTPCRTVCCALGSGPAAGISPVGPMEDTWIKYALNFVPMDLRHPQMSQLNPSIEHAFCFGSGWTRYDNTPQGAAQRLCYLVDHGAPYGYTYEAFQQALTNQAKEVE